jgi:hypothetical protein
MVASGGQKKSKKSKFSKAFNLHLFSGKSILISRIFSDDPSKSTGRGKKAHSLQILTHNPFSRKGRKTYDVAFRRIELKY